MALPKKQLRERLQEWGVSDEHIETAVKYILDGNSASLDALREQMETLQAKADKADELEKQLQQVKGDLDAAKASSGDAADIQAKFDAFKAEVAEKETTAKKAALGRAALTKAGANPQALDLLMNAANLAEIELDGDNLKDEAAFVKPYMDKYSAFFGTQQMRGTKEQNPPTGGTSGGSGRIAQIAAEYNRQHYGEIKE